MRLLPLGDLGVEEVLGAAGGIGQSVCRYFAGEGAAIAAIDKNASVKSFASELKHEGMKIAYAVADVGDGIPLATLGLTVKGSGDIYSASRNDFGPRGQI